MKKTVSLILALVMVLGFATAACAEAERNDQTVNIVGKLQTGGQNVKITLKNEDGPVYMNRVKADENGNYNANFKFKGDLSGVTALVELGEENIADTVISATTQSEKITHTSDVSEADALIEKIKNNYSAENAVVAVLYYDRNNRLLSAQNGFGTLKAPDQAKTVKAFIYGKGAISIPLEQKIDDSQKIKVLAIGNSYAVDAYAYLEEIARKEGVYLDLRIAQQSGASFRKHWNTWTATTEEGRKKYTENGEKVDIAHFLEDGTVYDFITIQESTLVSDLSKFNDCLVEVASYIRERQPTAEILIHKTWANEKGSPIVAFVDNYKGDQQAHIRQIDKTTELACKLLATVETDSGLKISLDGKPIRYIPAGDAVNIARESEMFDTTYKLKANWDDVNNYWAPEGIDESSVVSLHRDSYHLSRKYGRYLVGLVWYRCLTGNSVLNNTYTNKDYPITEEGRKIINAAAEKAVADTGIWN